MFCLCLYYWLIFIFRVNRIYIFFLIVVFVVKIFCKIKHVFWRYSGVEGIYKMVYGIKIFPLFYQHCSFMTILKQWNTKKLLIYNLRSTRLKNLWPEFGTWPQWSLIMILTILYTCSIFTKFFFANELSIQVDHIITLALFISILLQTSSMSSAQMGTTTSSIRCNLICNMISKWGMKIAFFCVWKTVWVKLFIIRIFSVFYIFRRCRYKRTIGILTLMVKWI